MNINDMKLGDVLALVAALKGEPQGESFYTVGNNYFVRSVTHALVGKLKAVGPQELVFEQASWVADSGRFHNALKDGLLASSQSEIEPFVNDVIIGRGAIIDVTEYRHALPTEQK